MSTASTSTATDPAMERALGLLAAGGFTFEVVDRCPAECVFCDDSLSHAA